MDGTAQADAASKSPRGERPDLGKDGANGGNNNNDVPLNAQPETKVDESGPAAKKIEQVD